MERLIKVEIIENYIKENNLSKTKFCKLCNITLRTLNKILSDNLNFDAMAIFKIAGVMDIQVYQMFQNN